MPVDPDRGNGRLLRRGGGFQGIVANFGRPKANHWAGAAFCFGTAAHEPVHAATLVRGVLAADVHPQNKVAAAQQWLERCARLDGVLRRGRSRPSPLGDHSVLILGEGSITRAGRSALPASGYASSTNPRSRVDSMTQADQDQAAFKVLMISGSTRANSTNAAALNYIRRSAPPGYIGMLYQGLSELPAFNPDLDDDTLPSAVASLRDAIAASDAVVISTPEYAGTLPGSLKNLLDWTVGGGEMSGKPVAWINVAAQGRGRGAVDTLESVLGYVGASIIVNACVSVPIPRAALDPDGELTDSSISAALSQIWAALVTVLSKADEGRHDD